MDLLLAEFAFAPLIAGARHRTVTTAQASMAHLSIVLDGDWVKVTDSKRKECRWMHVSTCVQLVPKDYEEESGADDGDANAPRRGRPPLKKS